MSTVSGQDYATHVLRLARDARLSGKRFWPELSLPPHVLNSIAQAVEKLEACDNYDSPYARRRAAERAAKKCKRRTGWAEHLPPQLARSFAAAFRALPGMRAPKSPGNKLGEMRSRQGRAIAEAFSELTEAKAGKNDNYLGYVFCRDLDFTECGGINKSPAGRQMLLKRARSLMMEHGIPVNHKKLLRGVSLFARARRSDNQNL